MNPTPSPAVKILSCLALAACTCLGHAQPSALDIRAFGARGDAATLNTAAIQHAIDSAARQGGGSVLVPPGTFVTGTLHLRSHVDLHLEAGAVLKGSAFLQDYMMDTVRVGLLFTRDAHNVSITGTGTIDGNGNVFMDTTRAKIMSGDPVKFTRQKDRFRRVASGLGDGPYWPKDRPFQMIIFSACTGVTLRDVHIVNSPFWTLHLADCDGVLLSGVTIFGDLMVPNNDGVDLTSCSNVRVSDCDIRTGDDAIVVTGYDHHFDLPGYNHRKRPCENIVVTNCTLISRSSAIRIGGFDQNPMRNFTFSNITITDSHRGIGLFVRDVGGIENVTFSNMIIHTRLHTGDWWGNGEPIHLSAVRLTPGVTLGRLGNIRFQNIECHSESGILVYGSDESVIDHVSFEGVSCAIAEGALTPDAAGNIDLRPVADPALALFAHDIPGIFATKVRDLSLRDVDITWEGIRSPMFTRALEVDGFDGLTIRDFHGHAAPPAGAVPAVLLRNGAHASVDRVLDVERKEVHP